MTVQRLNSAYRLIAKYSGDTLQHDILVSFDLGASAYLVTAELFEDGNGVAQISDSRTLGGVFLDPPQSILRNLVDLTVRDDLRFPNSAVLLSLSRCRSEPMARASKTLRDHSRQGEGDAVGAVPKRADPTNMSTR